MIGKVFINSICGNCVHVDVCSSFKDNRQKCSFYLEQRPHGEWVHTEDGECYCTICKVRDWTNSDDYRFCPWCGADMRVKKNE